jgi:DNA-binding NtrC family response regulator
VKTASGTIFSVGLRNRLTFPTKHILIVEDDIQCQLDVLNHFNNVFERQGEVTISVVSDAIQAAQVLMSQHNITKAIILDHDLQWGNGCELLRWMKLHFKDIPVITFSGHPQNNANMIASGASYHFDKDAVTQGKADIVIREILNEN